MKRILISIIVVLSTLQITAAEKKLTAYPNPVDKGAALTVYMPEGENGEMTITLYNAVGRAIHTTTTRNKEVEFNAPETSGIYILRIANNRKRVVAVERIIVRE